MKTINNLSLSGNFSVLTPDEKAEAVKKAEAKRIAKEKALEEEKRRKLRWSKIEGLENTIAVLSKVHIGIVSIGAIVLFCGFWIHCVNGEVEDWIHQWLLFISAHALIGLIQLICYIIKENL